MPQSLETEPHQTDGPEARYLQALREGRFLYQRRADGGAVFPPRLAAPGDGVELDWAASKGLGQVYSITAQPQRPPAPVRHIAIVEMDEGFRLLSRIEIGDGAAPRIDDRVSARIDTDAEPPHVYFVPA